MRLGLWNRLALVTGGIFTLGYPTWTILDDNNRMARLLESGYSTCLSLASDSAARVTCREIWVEQEGYFPGWGIWLERVVICAALAAILYGLLWTIVWMAKWVWRGRQLQS